MSNGFDEYIAQARQFAEAGMVDDAIEAYRIALSEDPANEEIRREIINLSLSKGDYQQTIVEYFDWAEACQGEGAIDDSIRIYQEILGLPTLLQKKVFMTDQELANETINQIQETIQTASGAIFFNLGYLYLEKSALEESISCLQKSLEFNPSDSKTHTLLGQVYMQMGNDNEAVGEFQEVVRLAPEDAAYAYEMLGEIFIRKGKPPQSTVAWFRNAGDLYLRNNQMEEAIRAYERILTIEQNNKDVLKRLAEIYAKQGSIEQAMAMYKQLAEAFSEAGMLDKVIIIYEKLAEWDSGNTEARDKIIEIYRKILERDPGNLQARHKLIGNLLRMGAAKDAIPEFIALSETYLKKNMKKEAFSVCRKLLELDPREARAHELIADIFYDQDKKEQALKEYLLVIKLYREKGDDVSSTKVNEKLVEMFPGTKEVTLQLAISHKQQEDYDSALNEFSKILADEPANVSIIEHMMEIYEKVNQLDKVIEFAYKIVNIDNTRTDMQDKIISIYERQGNTDKIIEIYKYMLKADPSRQDIRQKILDIYEKEGKQEKIIDMYKETLSQEPDRTDIRQKIIQFYASERRIDDVLRESSYLADIYLKNSDLDKAESLYKNVLAFMPGDTKIRENLCNIFEQKGEIDKVQDELLVLANLHYSLNNMEASLKSSQKILEYLPNDLNLKLRVANVAASCGDTTEAVNQYRDIAETFLDNKMTEPALEIIGNILSIDGENLEYRQKLIEILKNQFKLEEAIQNYKLLILHFLKFNQNDDAITAARDAIALQPMELDLRKEIIDLFMQGNDVQNARSFADELIEIYLNRSEYDEVNDLYDRLSQVYRTNDELNVYYEMRENIAEILERQSRYHDAIEEYLKILEGNLIDGNKDEAERLFPILVNLYFKEDRSLEAIKAFENLVEKLYRFGKTSEAIMVLEQKETMEERNDKWTEALESLNKMISIQRERGESEQIISTHKRRIEIFLKHDNIDSAIHEMFLIIEYRLENDDLETAMEQFLEIENYRANDPALSFRMAETLFKNEMFDQAQPLYEKVITKEPDNFDAMARIAIIFAKSGSLQDAVVYTKKIFSKGLVAEVIEEYKKSAEVDPDDAQVHINMGLFYQEIGFVEEAIAELQKAARDRERLLEAYNLLAMCFKQEGFVDLAIRQFERALEQPGYPEEDYLEIRYNLGETLLENHQYQEALSAFYECYMVDINYRDISEKIAMINEKLSMEEDEE